MHLREVQRKNFGFYSSVPTHPSPGYISYTLLGRRVVNFGDEYRRENVTRVFSTAVVRGGSLRRPECARRRPLELIQFADAMPKFKQPAYNITYL